MNLNLNALKFGPQKSNQNQSYQIVRMNLKCQLEKSRNYKIK